MGDRICYQQSPYHGRAQRALGKETGRKCHYSPPAQTVTMGSLSIMTAKHDTTEQGRKVKDTAKWLHEGRACLQVIKRIEAGTIDESVGSVPVGVTFDGDHILSLCENGQLWIMPDGPATEAFNDPEIMPAAKVAMLYRFFWPIAVADASEIMKQVGEAKQAAPPKPEPEPERDDKEHYSRAQRLELRIAPNCEGDILTYPPRIVTVDGTQFVQLKGHDGWHGPNYPVLEVTRMEAHDGLVLVATPEQVFLMTAADFDNPIE